MLKRRNKSKDKRHAQRGRIVSLSRQIQLSLLLSRHQRIDSGLECVRTDLHLLLLLVDPLPQALYIAAAVPIFRSDAATMQSDTGASRASLVALFSSQSRSGVMPLLSCCCCCCFSRLLSVRLIVYLSSAGFPSFSLSLAVGLCPSLDRLQPVFGKHCPRNIYHEFILNIRKGAGYTIGV